MTHEKENLALEITSLNCVIKQLKENDHSTLLAGINEIKAHLNNQPNKTILNDEPNTVRIIDLIVCTLKKILIKTKFELVESNREIEYGQDYYSIESKKKFS